jgi:hypothetical protein
MQNTENIQNRLEQTKKEREELSKKGLRSTEFFIILTERMNSLKWVLDDHTVEKSLDP